MMIYSITILLHPLQKLLRYLIIANRSALTFEYLRENRNEIDEENTKKVSSNKSQQSPRVIDSVGLVTRIVSHVSIMITFGVMFPPLSIIVLLSLYSYAYTTMLHVGSIFYQIRIKRDEVMAGGKEIKRHQNGSEDEITKQEDEIELIDIQRTYTPSTKATKASPWCFAVPVAFSRPQ
jgi:hypothetical protein